MIPKLYQRTPTPDRYLTNVDGNKINEKKILALLYKNDKEAEKEIRETSPFTIATNNIKYLGVTPKK